MSVAVVIGTHGTPCYVHLGLESLRRFCPGVPCLVHDDASPDRAQLESLCEEYGATFTTTPARLGHYAGDLAAFVAGFDWCPASVLVKFSRRFVPLADWRPNLTAATGGGGSMFCARGTIFGPIRSDCVAFDVAAWRESGKADRLRSANDQAEFLLWRTEPKFVEWNVTPALGFQLAGNYLATAQAWGLPYAAENFTTARQSLL